MSGAGESLVVVWRAPGVKAGGLFSCLVVVPAWAAGASRGAGSGSVAGLVDGVAGTAGPG